MLVAAGIATALAAPANATAPASAAGPAISKTRAEVHFDLSTGQTPENLAVATGGNVDVSFATSRQIAEVGPRGDTQILATLATPADGGINTPFVGHPLLTGLARARNGTLYFGYAAGSDDFTGLWRLQPGAAPERIAPLGAATLPNGLALDEHSGVAYIADSALGLIWRVPITGGTPTVWASGPELAGISLLGVNGLKVHHGAVWASNTDQGTIVRIPILRGGTPGAIETRVSDLAGIDDFGFVGNSDRILAALNAPNQVALVQPDGSHAIVLTAANGLQNPSAVAVRGDTAYVTDAAYRTGVDPNLLVVHLNRHGRP